jgi:Thioredoxin like C-terminal domain
MASQTPETYLGYQRISPQQFIAESFSPDRFATYRAPQRPLGLNEFALSGRMKLERERTVAGENAGLRMRFRAQDVHLVLSGRGTVQVRLDGTRQRTVRVNGARLYTLLELPMAREGLLELRFTPGLSAYAFTFG